MNIYEKMSAITNEITSVAKNLSVGYGKSSYKAVGEADILAAVKPAEQKYKVYSFPVDRDVLESGVLTSVRSDGTESKQQFLRVRTTYRFVDMENPADFIDITSYGDGVDSQDKAPGKAMTYADKYALMKAYKIITGDDPDQNYSDDLKWKSSKQAKLATDPQKTTIKALCEKLHVNLDAWLKQTGCTLDTLTAENAGKMLQALREKEEHGNAGNS